MGFVRAYLRASTDEQDAQRARQSLVDFAERQGLVVCTFYVENQSGAKLHRPELFRLLDDSQQGDILLVEDIDRLSRLNAEDWEKLKNIIKSKLIKIIAVNAPTSWRQATAAADDFESRILQAINDMLIDILAASARRDYEQRRQRQAQGIAKAKQQGKYKGRPKNIKLYNTILKLLDAGNTWAEVKEVLGCSSRTIARAKAWRNEQGGDAT